MILVDEALAGGKAPTDASVAAALTVVRLRALVRSGDPERALTGLADPVLRGPHGLPREERQALYAIALDRSARLPQALAALAGWRALLPETDPAAVYAEDRIAKLAPVVDRTRLRAVAQELSPSPARQCLEAIIGVRPPETAPAWIHACGGERRVGLLLPRTGALAALADIHLAAASVAVAVLLGEDAEVEVVHHDAGSEPATAIAGAQALVRSGVDTIVGPVGPANIEAVRRELGTGVELVIPGEAGETAIGVGPTLETRIATLIDHARRFGATRFVVLVPDNRYGRRAVEAVHSRLGEAGAAAATVAFYDPGLTSFAPIIAAQRSRLKSGAAVLIPDHVARVELLVRQLARAEVTPPAPGGGAGTLILTTGEGFDPARAGSDSALEGLWVAPAAAPSALAEPFIAAYHEAQGAWPSDQALLVFYALRRALLGPLPAGVTTGVAVIREGRLVPLQSE